jgi:hypothetical protein
MDDERDLARLQATHDRQKLEQIRGVIRDYHFDLDSRKHGGNASWVAFDKIKSILGMHWRQGEETKRRREQGNG